MGSIQLWPSRPGGSGGGGGGVRMDGLFDGRVRFGNGFGDETTFAVPAEKCGLVIGKGKSKIFGFDPTFDL